MHYSGLVESRHLGQMLARGVPFLAHGAAGVSSDTVVGEIFISG